MSHDFSEATTKPGEGGGHHSDVRPHTEPDRGEEPGNRPPEPAAGPDPVRDGGTKIGRGPEGTGTERERERERERQRDRETERQTDRQTDRDRQRHRERERETERQRDRDTVRLRDVKVKCF